MEHFFVFDIIGLIAFSVSGFLVGVRKKLDMLGIAITTFCTALAGGIVRDALSSKIPFAFSHFYPSVSVFCVFLLLILFNKFIKDDIEKRIIFVTMDAIGLVAFALAGAMVAIDSEFNLFGVIILSFLTDRKSVV